MEKFRKGCDDIERSMTNTVAISRMKGEAGLARGLGEEHGQGQETDSKTVLCIVAAQHWGEAEQGAAGFGSQPLAHKSLVYVITFFGVPNTWQILKIVSISLAPGKRGRRVYTSAMMQPTAQTSMGEL